MQPLLDRTQAGRRIFVLWRAWALIVALLPGVAGAGSAPAPRFTVTLDRNSIVLGEAVTLTLSFEGAQPQEISPLPQVDGLRVASAVSSGFNSTMAADGTTTSIWSYTVSLAPTRAGEFVIPPFQAKAGGERLSSEPLKLKVAASETSMPPPEYAGKPAFLWVVPPKQQLYVGETTVLEIRLYVRREFDSYQNLSVPLSGEGFTFSKILFGPQFQRQVGAGSFAVIPLYVAVTPLKTGNFTLSTAGGYVHLTARGIFEVFGRPAQRVGLVLEPVSFQVSPLPSENVPPDFKGAVGNYSLSVSAGPTNLAVGDPLTVRIRVAGQGQLDGISLPEQTAWREFKTYPSTSTVAAPSELHVEGTNIFEQIVVPQNTGIKALPSVAFSYFDPAQKSYRSIKSEAIPLTVRPAGSGPLPVVTRPAEPAPPQQDVVPIKQRLGTIAHIGPPLVQRPWFLALQSAPVLALVSSLIWRKRNEMLVRNPRLRRQRQVARIIRQGLTDLQKFAAENNSDEFFATLFRLLQEQLGERLDVPAFAITESVLEEQLEPRGAPEAMVTDLHELFQACNLARYAPIKTSQELAAFIPRTESVLRELQEWQP
jgi:BatD DUF11 like domain